jgi:cation diffusion facilitator family transporter
MNKARAGYIEGIVSIIINIFLFVIKLWAGIVSGSVALTADAWHTLSDSVSSLIVIAGGKLSARKADREHPFGHGRWEQIASIFIGVLLALIAYDFLMESIERFKEHEPADFGLLAIIVTIVSVILKEGLARYAFYIGKKTGNSTVKADGWHHRTDALSSVIVLAGILLKDFFWWIDSLMGLLISLMIFYTVYQIMNEAISTLLGEKPPEGLIGQVREIIQSNYREGLQSHHFHYHDYGTHQELTFHIKLSGDVSIYRGHDIATIIENEIREKLGIETTIHVEPGGKVK